LPPIRNKAFKKKKKSKSKVPSKITTDENKKNKIKSYDYEAWGKLDVVSWNICLLAESCPHLMLFYIRFC